MLFPKKVKHRKWHTTRRNKERPLIATRGAKLSFGSHGLKATTSARIKSNQIESARKVIARNVSKTGKMWTRIFPDRPYTSKSGEVPMGNGKGDPQGYCFQVEAGRIIFEIDGVNDDVAKEALRKAGTKLPFLTKVVTR